VPTRPHFWTTCGHVAVCLPEEYECRKYLRAPCKLETTVPLFVLCKTLYALHWPTMVFDVYSFLFLTAVLSKCANSFNLIRSSLLSVVARCTFYIFLDFSALGKDTDTLSWNFGEKPTNAAKQPGKRRYTLHRDESLKKNCNLTILLSVLQIRPVKLLQNWLKVRYDMIP